MNSVKKFYVVKIESYYFYLFLYQNYFIYSHFINTMNMEIIVGITRSLIALEQRYEAYFTKKKKVIRVTK